MLEQHTRSYRLRWGMMKVIYILIFSSLLMCPMVFAGSEVDRARLEKIAESVIKMQIINDPNSQKNLDRMAALIVNSDQKDAKARILDPIPPEGIANYLRSINTKFLAPPQSARMLAVINEEIDQISKLFARCQPSSAVQQDSERYYFIEIQCDVPQASTLQIAQYHKEMNDLEFADIYEEKIATLSRIQKILAHAEHVAFVSRLYFLIEADGSYLPIIQDDDYFPNRVITQRQQGFERRKVDRR